MATSITYNQNTPRVSNLYRTRFFARSGQIRDWEEDVDGAGVGGTYWAISATDALKNAANAGNFAITDTKNSPMNSWRRSREYSLRCLSKSFGLWDREIVDFCFYAAELI